MNKVKIVNKGGFRRLAKNGKSRFTGNGTFAISPENKADGTLEEHIRERLVRCLLIYLCHTVVSLDPEAVRNFWTDTNVDDSNCLLQGIAES